MLFEFVTYSQENGNFNSFHFCSSKKVGFNGFHFECVGFC